MPRHATGPVKDFVVDFAPGLHGHFLEYVLNRYIFGIDTQLKSIFQSSGACHPINTDADYQDRKVIGLGHYSAFGYSYPMLVKKIIFVEHDPILDFVLLTNIYHRCHPDSITVEDFNVDEIKAMHEMLAFPTSETGFKNDWYAKLMEHQFFHADQQPQTDLPVYRFQFKSFFDLYDFLLEIRKVANFLEHTFLFDSSLVTLWQEFIRRNQGYQLWRESQRLFASATTGARDFIPDDWKIHAHLNYQISQVFHLYDHSRLFMEEPYPASTSEIHDIIDDHIKTFDQRW